MPIRLDNNGKRKALICEELKPETRYEEHVRIEEEKEFKKQRKNKRAINKMKKQGKLCSISGFLVVKDEEDDDYIKSKKEKFVRNRSIRGSTLRSRNDGGYPNSKITLYVAYMPLCPWVAHVLIIDTLEFSQYSHHIFIYCQQ